MKAAPNSPVWAEIAPELLPGEFKAPYEMDEDFLRKLSAIRRESKVPFRLISDARPVTADIGAEHSAHKERPGIAVDLQVYSARERWLLVFTAIKHGITRIGVYPGRPVTGKGTDVGSIHLDGSNINPSPRMWTRY